MAEGRPPYSNIHPMRAIFMIPSRPPPKLTEPDDWPPAPAARDGSLRPVAGRQAVRGANYHGDPALAGAALPGLDRDHLHSGDHPVAADAARTDPVGHGRISAGADVRV